MPTRKIARSATSGQFITIAETKRQPATSVIETVHVSRTGVRRLKRRRSVCPQTRPGFKAGRDL